jgi:hypothetical protein
MKNKLPEPGTNERGEKYNNLPIDYKDEDARTLDPPQGTDYERHYKNLFHDQEEEPENLSLGEEPVEDASPVEALPSGVSAMATWTRKHGGVK